MHTRDRRPVPAKTGRPQARALSLLLSTALHFAVLAAVLLVSSLLGPLPELFRSVSGPASPSSVASSSFVPWLFADAVSDPPSAEHAESLSFGLRGDRREAENAAGSLLKPRRLSAAEDSTAEGKSVADLAHPLDVVGVLAIGSASIIAVAAGAGGGAIYVPIMILVMGFTVYEATATSQALMFGGSLAGTCLNLFRRHPFADRPAIDLDLVLLMGPMQIAGATYGLVINRCWPVYLIMAVLVVLLFATAYKTSRQMMRLKREGAAARKLLEQRSGSVCEVLQAEELEEEERAQRCTDVRGDAKTDPTQGADRDATQAAAANEGLDGGDAAKRDARKSDFEFVPVTQSETENSDGESQRAKSQQDSRSTANAGDGEAHGENLADASPRHGACEGDEHRITVPSLEPKPRESERRKGSALTGSSPDTVPLATAPQSLRYALRGHSSVKWFAMFVVYAINLVFTIVKGGPRTRWQIVPYCGLTYWGVYVLGAVFLMCCSYVEAICLWRKHAKEKQKVEAAEASAPAVKQKGELEYTLAHLHSLMAISLVAGMMAGIIGIGGGLILGPYLLVKGVPPAVTTSVNTTLILFTSSSAAAISIASATAPWDYCLLLFGVCFLTTLIGKAVVDKLVKRYHADYILVLLLLIIMLGSVVCTVVSGVLTIKKGEPRDLSFKSPCY
ncbi:hypothetical protein NCLIV_020390 [Neospora caninum Liverpool]|uniref:Sulfite exporter TauE/SafE protein n=1 Tax=Neospora caninum (strain Liverpool) TaxID=572307 RepID=F0VEV8_NEOCL|nr:hypothetical protein NCLIV_020390 [Neospora caninum Liverpool]CBZ52252.1 hypothetical protein NCLIV_020390 [Neospora caninum Liverpool]CEL66220.1 TPA: hypothetical protein BN1204_020390 [Neospora caninum Liverpool]|eukprot:XP_003882284.1 hypothetical protein NCLIV_020390 [Neospora caninum Liverpool]